MEQYCIIFLLATLFSAIATSLRISKHYRSDYEYNSKSDAFYKFHTESIRGWSAHKICEIEGSKLLTVESHDDVIQVHSMFKRFPDLPQYAWIAQDGQLHDSTEEHPLIYLSQELDYQSPGLCDVVDRAGKVKSYPCYQQIPFFCKVKASVASYDSQCGVYSAAYEYIASVGSCYRIPSSPYTWNEAYAECRAEGAHLLVLNSRAESLAVQNLTRHTNVIASRAPWFYYAGYRAAPAEGNKSLVFKTIFNQTLEEAGYSEWSPNEPNNAQGNEYCGTFFNNDGKLNDVKCSDNYGFICENEVLK